MVRPVNGARLLFQHRPAAARRTTAVEIMMESSYIRVALAGICKFVGFGEWKAV
jgi:hypothetical protein